MRGWRRGRIVAAFGPIISRGNKIGDALGGGLFGEAISKCKLSVGGEEFATTKALGHNVGEIIFDDVGLREVNPIRRIGGGGDNQVHGGVVRDRTGPRGVEGGFGFFAAPEITWIGAVNQNVARLKNSTALRKRVPMKALHVLAWRVAWRSAVKIAPAHNANRHPLPGKIGRASCRER